MKYLVAVLLLAVLAVNSGDGQATRATRATTRGAIPPRTVTRPAVTRSAPVRQTVATRAPTTTPRRQAPPAGPPQPTRVPSPTRAPPAGPQQPPQPTRAPPAGPQVPPQPTRGPVNPQQPDPNPVPTAPIVFPTVTPRFSTPPPFLGGPGVPDSRCPRDSDIRRPVQLPHPTNCNRFFKCQNGLALAFQCPPGQHWNAAKNYCDFPNNANCGGNNWNQPPNQPNWNQPINPPMAPQFPNWQQPQQPINPPNWQQPINPPNWQQPQQPINPPSWNNPIVPQVPDFQHPIEIPLVRGK